MAFLRLQLYAGDRPSTNNVQANKKGQTFVPAVEEKSLVSAGHAALAAAPHRRQSCPQTTTSEARYESHASSQTEWCPTLAVHNTGIKLVKDVDMSNT